MFIDFIYLELNKHIGGLPLLRIAQYRYGNFLRLSKQYINSLANDK